MVLHRVLSPIQVLQKSMQPPPVVDARKGLPMAYLSALAIQSMLLHVARAPQNCNVMLSCGSNSLQTLLFVKEAYPTRPGVPTISRYASSLHVHHP